MVGSERGQIREAEGRFAGFARRICRSPRTAIAAVGTVTALLVSGLASLTFDTSFESFLDQDDEARLLYEDFREQFGRSELGVLLVRVPDSPADPEFLHRLRALHEDVEASVPHLHDVTSLINIRDTRAYGDTLVVHDLVREIPRNAAETAVLAERMNTNRLYRNLLLSADSKWTVVIAEPDHRIAAEEEDDTGAGNAAAREADVLSGFDAQESATRILTSDDSVPIADALALVVAKHRSEEFDVRLGGGLVMGALLSEATRRDFGRLVGIATCAVAVLLYAVFRRLTIVLLALGVVLLSLASSIGSMAWLGIPVNFGTQILPTFLLTVGVGYSVHVLTLFDQRFAQHGDKLRAVVEAVDHAGLAIVMTALTTIGGLASFAAADLAPVASIGIFAPIGISLCLVYSLVLLPALLVVLPMTRRLELPSDRAGEWLARCGAFSVAHRHGVLVAVVCVLVASAVGISRLRFSHDPMSWFPEDAEFRLTAETLDREFGGAYPVEFLISATDGNSVRDPELLARLDELEVALAEIPSDHVALGKVVGLHSIVKEIHQALNGDDPAAYVVPQDRKLVAQELLLFENGGSDALEATTDANYRRTRLTARINWADAYHTVPYVRAALERGREVLGDRATLEVTGMVAIAGRTFLAVIDSMVRSYGIAIAVITVCMIAMVGQLRGGLVSLVPNLTPIVVTLGVMGFLGIPLNSTTLLIGSIALGLAVDDTIHFVHSYLRAFDAHGDSSEAVRTTLESTGVALLFTSVALVCGFSLFSLASLGNLVHFGLATAFAIAAAFAADILISPGLMVLALGESRASKALIESDPADEARTPATQPSPAPALVPVPTLSAPATAAPPFATASAPFRRHEQPTGAAHSDGREAQQ